jgi:hypothetical protein
MKYLMIRTILFVLILHLFLASFAQPVNWKAHWIMHPTAEPQAHAVILFRKNFELPKKPKKFVIHLSADNHYRLFVNGKYITRGPARGDISHWFFETLDIAGYLQSGKNNIVAEVVNWGPKRSFTYFSQMTSFILQGDSNTEKLVKTSGGCWKCVRNEAYSPKIVEWMTDRNTIDFGLYVGNPTDSIRADNYPWGWETIAYDDSNWLPAKWCDIAGGRDEQFTGGILYGGGKMLIPRLTGILKEEKVMFAGIRRSTGMDVKEDFLKGTGSLIIPANTTVSVLIDQTVETMGYPEMLVSGGKDARIQAMYAENMIVKKHSPKGNRNDIDVKFMVGIKDVFIPDGGQNRFFKTNLNTAFRVQIFRKGALMGTERGEWHGDKMSYYSEDQNGMGEIVVKASERTGKDEGGFVIQEPIKEAFVSPRWWKTDMLPEPLRHDSGHDGSHTFITHEFIDSLVNNRKPLVDIYEAIAYTSPGIVAHQSALKGGEYMAIPSFDI